MSNLEGGRAEFHALDTNPGAKTISTTATTNSKPLKPKAGGWADVWRPLAVVESISALLQGPRPSWSVLCWVFHIGAGGHCAAGSRCSL